MRNDSILFGVVAICVLCFTFLVGYHAAPKHETIVRRNYYPAYQLEVVIETRSDIQNGVRIFGLNRYTGVVFELEETSREWVEIGKSIPR